MQKPGKQTRRSDAMKYTWKQRSARFFRRISCRPRTHADEICEYGRKAPSILFHPPSLSDIRRVWHQQTGRVSRRLGPLRRRLHHGGRPAGRQGPPAT